MENTISIQFESLSKEIKEEIENLKEIQSINDNEKHDKLVKFIRDLDYSGIEFYKFNELKKNNGKGN